MGIQRCSRKVLAGFPLSAYEVYYYGEWFKNRIEEAILSLPRALHTREGYTNAVYDVVAQYIKFKPPKIELNVQLEPEIHMLHIEGVITV